MARSRNIKPGLFKNEILGVADPLYTLLFEGLWLLADREGRLEDRPLRIKAEVFPYRESINMNAMLDWLQDNGFIIRYEYGEYRYIQIANFDKHQNPHKNEPASTIPMFSKGNIEVPNKSELVPNKSEALGLIPDSLNLIPDSLNTETPITDSVESLTKNGFEEFWKEYPSKTGKAAAKRRWERLKPDNTTVTQILEAVVRQKSWGRWQDGYIPNPDTWLNQKRWMDEEPPSVKQHATQVQQLSPSEDPNARVVPLWESPPKLKGVGVEQAKKNIANIKSMILGKEQSCG